MKVFMLGWEFPPMISGGLGVACYGLVKALNGMGVDVMFVLPRPARKAHSARAPYANGKSGHQNGFAMLTGDQGNGRSMRTLVKVRQVTAPSAAQVHEAVGHGVGLAPRAPEREEPQRETASSGENRMSIAAEETEQILGSAVEEGGQPPLQRVTFVPMDVKLQPYMTAEQYFRMVVDVSEGGSPDAAWATRAAHAGAQGPVLQPPNAPARQITHATPPPQPQAKAVQASQDQRDYIDEPAAASRVMGPPDSTYAGDLFSETERYARLALAVAKGEQFEVVHAHDWMTFEAAMAVAAATGKPLVLQIHSTELDRAGAQANRRIMEVERNGMNAAARVVAVSYKTRTQLVEKYGIDPQKIEVVYNATERVAPEPAAPLRKKQKTVLFLGRLTEQKGPDYFLRAAKKVLAVEPDVKFVIAGKGDLLADLKKLTVDLGIKKKVVFTGFLKKDPVEKAFRAADVYVMPSLSEPFGITPLEALAHDVPVIISRQSGVAEVLRHVLKVDFWDTDDLANKIIAVLRHPPLAQTLRERGHEEVRQLSWDDSARRIMEMYQVLAGQVTAAVGV